MSGGRGKVPGRPQSHVTGETALNAFNNCRPQDWATTEAKRDYGYDIWVALRRDEGMGEDFFVQLKGSAAPRYVNGRAHVAKALRTSTLNWLCSKGVPIMICVCDTGQPDEPVYWAWLDDALGELAAKKPNWAQQKTATIRIRTQHRMERSCKEEINTYVRDYYATRSIKAELGEVIAPTFRVEQTQVREAYMEAPREFMRHEVIPTLADAGVVEPTGEPLTRDDQRRLRKIREASVALDNLHDAEAEAVLDQVSGEMPEASTGIRARYFNNRGVLALHRVHLPSALSFFEKAHSLKPRESKYATNVLITQYELVARKHPQWKRLPKDWQRQLQAVFLEKPDFGPALRLKAYWLGENVSSNAAEELLKGSPLWEKEPLPCSVVLAEVNIRAGNIERAIELLARHEDTANKVDGIFWTVFGDALSRTALGLSGSTLCSVTVYGPGPHNLDVTALHRARHYYLKAFDWFAERGMPRWAEQTVLNYCHCLDLLGEYEECEKACESYLRRHPESHPVKETFAGALFHQQKYADAIQLMREAYSRQPDATMPYKNLLLCLFFAEEYDYLVELARQRQDRGFVSKEEEGLSRSLTAISFFELAEDAKSKEQIHFMRSREDFSEHAAPAEAAIAKKNGAPKEQVAEIIRAELRKQPRSVKLASHLALNLAPPTPVNSVEIEECLNKVRVQRQLIPEEFNVLGQALMTIGKPEEAEKVFRDAYHRYPSEPRFLCERAYALAEMGEAEAAFQALQAYLPFGKKSYLLIRNMAMIAMETDRLDRAISLFQRALRKTPDETEIAMLHCQLYELRKRRGDLPKDLLRHVVEYGKLTQGRPEAEVRYFGMFLLSPPVPRDQIDDEVTGWIKELRCRLQEFSARYPDYPAFRTLRFPADASDKEQREHFFATLSEITLPHRLASVPLQLATRTLPWPLAFRSQNLPSCSSMFDYWDYCTASKDFADGIHIFSHMNNYPAELRVANSAQNVCIDLTALLTLAEFDLLDFLRCCFKRLLLAKGTRMVLEDNLFGVSPTHRLAKTIHQWRLANRSLIRIGSKPPRQPQGRGEQPLDLVLGGGVGETFLMAEARQVPLFSDETTLRFWVASDSRTHTFSTLAFLERLTQDGLIAPRRHVACLARMITLNFRTIPLRASHFNTRLKELLSASRQESAPVNNDTLLRDEVLGPLLGRFGDTAVHPRQLVQLAVNWWVCILLERRIPSWILPACMHHPTFALCWRPTGGVLSGVSSDDPPRRASDLWARFLWSAYRQDIKLTSGAWQAIATISGRLFQEPTDQQRVLYQFLPQALGAVLERDGSSDNRTKTSYLFELARQLEPHDTAKFEEHFAKHKPKFFA